MKRKGFRALHALRPLLAAAAALAGPPAGAVIIIDTFEEGTFALADDSSTPNPSLGQGPAQGLTEDTVIKAIRHLNLNHSGSLPDAGEMILDGTHPGGVRLIRNEGGQSHSIFSYSGFQGFPSATNLNVDFSGEQALVMEFSRVDYPIAATTRVYSNTGGTFAINTIVISSPGTYYVPYTSFSDPDFGWSNVTRLNVDMNITGPGTGEVIFEDFRADIIPEPAAATLLTLAAGFVLRRRR